MSEVDQPNHSKAHSDSAGGGRGRAGRGGRGGRGMNRSNPRPSSRNDNRRPSNTDPYEQSGGERRGSQDLVGPGMRWTVPPQSSASHSDRRPSDASSSTATEDRFRRVTSESKKAPAGSASDWSPKQSNKTPFQGTRVSNSGSHWNNKSSRDASTSNVYRPSFNSNAPSFQPAALSSISDVDAEVLITPAPDQTHFPVDQQGHSFSALPPTFVPAESTSNQPRVRSREMYTSQQENNDMVTAPVSNRSNEEFFAKQLVAMEYEKELLASLAMLRSEEWGLQLPDPEPESTHRRGQSAQILGTGPNAHGHSYHRRGQSVQLSGQGGMIGQVSVHGFPNTYPPRGHFRTRSAQIPAKRYPQGGPHKFNKDQPKYQEHVQRDVQDTRIGLGQYYVGTLEVHPHDRSKSSVIVNGITIHIRGSGPRNRALHGEEVAVQLITVEQFTESQKLKEARKRRQEEDHFIDHAALLKTRQEDMRRDDVEVEGQHLFLTEVPDEEPSFYGKVMGPRKVDPLPRKGSESRFSGIRYSGSLELLRPYSVANKEKKEAQRRNLEGVDLSHQANEDQTQASRIFWFRAADKRVPLIAMMVDQAPEGFLENPATCRGKIYLATPTHWDTSEHHPCGLFCRWNDKLGDTEEGRRRGKVVVESIGNVGDIEAETRALIAECGFSEFWPNNIERDLPALNWQIPKEQFDPIVRTDLRNKLTFTIDHEGTKDLQTAFHICKDDDGTFEVGVHVADVTFFVKPENLLLNSEAMRRATSVNLVQRTVPMLPTSLTEGFCAFTPGQDRLAFSVVFRITPDGRVDHEKTLFRKTIIRSAAQLSFSQVQEMINGKEMPKAELHGSKVSLDDINTSINQLNSLAFHLRQRRAQSWRAESPKLCITLDDKGSPVDCKMYKRTDVEEMVAAFLNAADIAVASKVVSGLKQQAIIRCQQPPYTCHWKHFVNKIQRNGLGVDTSDCVAAVRSLSKLEAGGTISPFVAQLLRSKMMVRDEYVCVHGTDIANWSHLGLDAPVFTDFTKPMTRFASIEVHRQLEVVILGEMAATANPHMIYAYGPSGASLVETAQLCNKMMASGKLAEERSQHLHLCHLISNLTKEFGLVVRSGTVIGISADSFVVAVPDFVIEKRVHVEMLPIDKHEFDEPSKALKLYWKKDVDVASHISKYWSNTRSNSGERQAQLMEASSQSTQAESALFEDQDNVEDHVAHSGLRANKENESVQRAKSKEAAKPVFESIERIEVGSNNVHHVQILKPFQSLPVFIVSDNTKSPPIVKVFPVNPFS